jgi:arylesterase/paraoxonase
MGSDREVIPDGAEACRVVEAPAGPEDLEIDTLTGLAWISAQDRRDPAATGDLWVLDLAEPDGRPVRVERDGPAVFRPHGIGLARTAAGLFVWVVNHPGSRHTLEAFELTVEGGRARARHLTTVASPALVSPNDVAAIDTERFYVTNDHGTTGGFPRLMEDLLGLNLANVLYFDGARFEEAVGGLSYANGVALGLDGAELVVAEVFGGAITFHDREPNSGRVRGHLLVDLDSGADNISVAPDGSFWIAGHPRLLDFAAHASDASARSPTEVFRVQRTEGGATVERVIADDGALLSGGSVAAAWRDEVLVAGVFEPRLLRCVLPAELAMAGPPPEIAPTARAGRPSGEGDGADGGMAPEADGPASMSADESASEAEAP